MGLAIAQEIPRHSTLPLSKSLWWLAGFGFTHSAVEWLVIVQTMPQEHMGFPHSDLLPLLVLSMMVISGLLLVQFGASLLASSIYKAQLVRWIGLLLLPLWLLTLWLTSGGLGFSNEVIQHGTVTARYVFYVPGTVLSALALLSQRGLFKSMGMPQIAHDCTWGAAVFGFKGIVAGLIVPPANFFPASVLNYTSFLATVGLHAAVFRALAAAGITFFVLRVLRQFAAQQRRELQHASHQLKRLSTQVLNAQEEERKRVARELHDDTAQLLSSLLLRLKMLQRAESLDEVLDRSKHLVELATQATEGVRRMAFELRPAALEDLGLPAAIRWYAEELAAPRGLSVNVCSGGLRDRLPAHVELTIYRVVQEALTNVAKHSGARRADVTLEQAHGGVRVLVEDDGCGFDVNELAHSQERGLGLFGMRERVSLLGGALQIDSRIQRGTRITLEIPIAAAAVGGRQ